ncbi:hypothetical protein TNCV_873281 [Trichonephila clavipes]|nr:hypothetical protein TNCV_873281 [Trichonephila clavipes]
MLIRSRQWGIKCRKHHSLTCTRDFHHQRFEKTTLIFIMQKRRKIFLRIRNKELGSSSVQGVPSTDVAVPDLSQSSAKETDSRRGSHQFQTGHYLGVPGESGGLERLVL